MTNDWSYPHEWENFSLWVYDAAGRLVHLKNYPSLAEAEQAMRGLSDSMGSDGLLIKLYHKPKSRHRYELLKRSDTRSRRPA